MKTVLITGGTGGIGSQIVQFLLAKQYRVIIWGRSQTKFDTFESALDKATLEQVTFQTVDVSNHAEVELAFQKINNLDLLINAAGVVWPIGKIAEVDLAKFKASFDINFFGTLNTCHYAIPLLLKSPHGKIINFSGGGSAFARENHAAYGCSKTAVVRLTENLALEYPDIDCNVIAPGAHKTPMWNDETFDQEPKQWANMGELLEFIDFLVSETSNGITGKFLHFKDKRDNMLETIQNNSDLYTLRRIDNFQFLRK